METLACFSKTTIWVVMFLLLGLAATAVHGQGTSVGFYSKSCPEAESIVKSTVAKHLNSNARKAPGLLRLHFHDCFVRGCDGSVLIEGMGTEKTAVPNSGINGYDVINDAKTQLEAKCPNVVSCADILALAARDSVCLTKGMSWAVPTGRKDGRVSLVSETSTLPGPTESVSSQIQKFSALGLSIQDLVVLVGGHTIGTTSCGLVARRLYNFTTTTPTGADPAIDPSFVPILRAICPQGGDATKRVELDNRSGSVFDISYFNNLRRNRGVLQSDQFLWSDSRTLSIVQRLLNPKGPRGLNFADEFGKSMIKMSNVGVKTSPSDGEIRKVCTAINT